MSRVEYQINPEYAKLTQIVPGLFICGISELNRHNIEKNGITMIINATNEQDGTIVIKHFITFDFDLLPI
ncbi:unnamed protein product [Onchocerca ochengi]|uniref:DNA distortion polypeptide 3 n=1 Tax=Onchocerca ochengi TaxID=42157 RepID=A0A182EVT2_ONCOC|nr:unnamed protein product [Onchocerca ochengi]